MTIEKLIDLVFTEMVYRKIQQLEEATLSKKMKLTGINGPSFESASRCVTRKNGGYVMLSMLSNCKVAKNN